MDHYDFALDIVRRAGERVMRALEGDVHVSHKEGPRDPVTQVDIEVSNFLVSEITATYPDHRVYSEEGAKQNGVQMEGYEWVLDPIDGTGNFSHRIPHFSICVALLENGLPTLGAIYNPVTRELFSFKKEGAFLNGVSARPSIITEPSEAQGLLIVGHQSPLWPWGEKVYPALLRNLNKLKGLGSANLDLAFLAAGRADVVVYGTFSMPDGAAGVGMVRAAGGEVYDLKTGKPLELFTGRRSIAATANTALFEKVKPLLHQELLPA